MNIKNAEIFIKQELNSLYNKLEIVSLTSIIFQEILGLDKVKFLSDKELLLSNNQKQLLSSAISDLKNQKPIQYIVGNTEFFGSIFFVNKNVLIPRPETEELVELFLKNENLTSNHKIIDIGTGSGCISVSIAKNSKIQVFATDISNEALNVAKKNAANNSANVNFSIHDILKNDIFQIEKELFIFDFIISNPPYVRKMEAQMMQKNVLNNEPHLALFVEDDNPLIYYKAIANFAKKSLKKGGKIYLEVNEYIADSTAEIFKTQIFCDVKIKNDIFDKKRFIVVIK
ncbi:MAG: peptide chain release factor N(5)-glutamine methyltransferase [Bacteroidota bacterium]|nr:peptide chain release factor N(5)-glutamine methyltransferase [Bacteroidota bacterium]